MRRAKLVALELTGNAATRVKIVAAIDQTDEFLKDADIILVYFFSLNPRLWLTLGVAIQSPSQCIPRCPSRSVLTRTSESRTAYRRYCASHGTGRQMEGTTTFARQGGTCSLATYTLAIYCLVDQMHSGQAPNGQRTQAIRLIGTRL